MFTGLFVVLGGLTLSREWRGSRHERRERDRREAFKKLLGQAMNHGTYLRGKDTSGSHASKWASLTADLISSALGISEANIWMETSRLRRKELVGRGMAGDLISGCNRATADLIQRLDTLSVAEGFNPDQWSFVSLEVEANDTRETQP